MREIQASNTSQRHCLVHQRKWENGSWVQTGDIKAIFLLWGNVFEEFDAGPGNQTIGIVELDDGQVIEVLPHQIKFLDR